MSLKGACAVVVSVLLVVGCTTGPGSQPAASAAPTSVSAADSSPSPAPTGSTAPHERPLTAGETQLARTVFGDSVDCSVVLVHNHAYPLLGGFQPDDTAVTPNGEMYFPEPSYLPDFSVDPRSARWFVHEMVHVWQYQLGYPVSSRGMDRAALRYDYELDAQLRLGDYDMEQQGDIVADYVAMTALGGTTSRDGRYSSADLPLYRAVLADFLADPADPVSLPKR